MLRGFVEKCYGPGSGGVNEVASEVKKQGCSRPHDVGHGSETGRRGLSTIRDIQAFPVWVGFRNQLLVKVTTEDGLVGWGESGLSGRERAVMGAIEHYRELLIGRDARSIGALWQELYRSQYFEGGRVLTAAISAIDIALYDIKGKALNVPIYQLLGGKHRDRVPILASTASQPGPRMLEEAQEYAADGFPAIRLSRAEGHGESEAASVSEPWLAIAQTAPWMIRAREALGDGLVLGLDFHHRLSLTETASFCQKLPRGTLDFLEEPMRDETPEAYEALRRMTEIPFALGEEFASKWQALPYIERGIAQYMRLDVCNIGGFTEAMKVAGWCEAHYVDLLPHNPLGPICTMASIHLAAAVPNFTWLEYNQLKFRPPPPLELELFQGRAVPDGIHFPLPTGPGLGVVVNEKLLTEKAFQSWGPPVLRRRDGSFQNW
ncbi:MAG: mandelate racemase/muconate lactonizing enzyme family protein [Proteobacteria bacterium]|nr:mandelate racemase/muconate lactonizing enzyme family protein [Pseudomonadota bacterium]MBI3499258.1 mandelate racemase/muconate lactonizing enzyme family protein [Pseudomonadota bacterium]